MKIITVLLLLFSATFAFAQGSHWTNGYYRNDGTFVPGHYQTNPNGNPWDNWSTRGNYNPYTGKPGTVDPSGPGSNYYNSGHYYYDAYGNPHYVSGR
jgi:hypothetical protein